MAVELPEDVPEEVRRLGEPVAAFQAGAARVAAYWVVGALALLLGVGLGATAVALVFAPAGRGARTAPWGRLAVVAVFLLTSGIATLRKARGTRGLRVLVFPEALAHVRGAGAEVVRWDDVNAVRRLTAKESGELTISSPHRLVLECRGGRTCTFDESLSGLRELRRLAEEHTLKHMLPPAVEAYEAGATIGFGEVSVSREGIHHGAGTLPWELFDGGQADRGQLTVRSTATSKPFYRIDLDKVPNAHVLLALAEYAHSRAR